MPHTTVRALDLDQALEQYDSKFRFVLLASTRAEQLVRGARPKLEGVSKKHTRIAMEELKAGVVPWSYGFAPAAQAAVAEGETAAPASGDGAASSEKH
jgi:DNA-directed RNA polymerase omega subunit